MFFYKARAARACGPPNHPHCGGPSAGSAVAAVHGAPLAYGSAVDHSEKLHDWDEIDRATRSSDSELEAVFSGMAERGVRFLVVPGDPFLQSRGEIIAALGKEVPRGRRHHAQRIRRRSVKCGADVADAYHRSGALVAKVLAGATPAILPVERVSKIRLVINLKTAKALGLTVPQLLLAQADKVIE